MRELAIQAANGTLTTTDRATLDTEFQELIAEIDRIADATTFNGVILLDGTTATLDIQVGIERRRHDHDHARRHDGRDARHRRRGRDQRRERAAPRSTAIDAAIDRVSTARGTLGAGQNRLQSAIASIANARENLSAAESRIRDVDVAARDRRPDAQLDPAAGRRVGARAGQRAAAARADAAAGLIGAG